MEKFLKELHKIIDARKYALDNKAVNWDYPRFFITRPIPLPNNLPKELYPTGFRSNRRKFNKIIDKVKEEGKYNIINLAGFTSQNKDKLLRQDGSVSEKGYEQFWIELSDSIQKDDEKARTITNKLKAKQLSQAMEVDLLLSDDSDSESHTSGILPLPEVNNKKEKQRQSPVRRSLTRKFDKVKRSSLKSRSPSHTQASKSNAGDRKSHHKPARPPHQFPGFYRPRRRYQGFNPFYPQLMHHGFTQAPRFFNY